MVLSLHPSLTVHPFRVHGQQMDCSGVLPDMYGYTVRDHELGQSGGSGLFCTLLLEELQSRVDCTIEEEVYTSEVPNLSEDHLPKLAERRLCPTACISGDPTLDLEINVFRLLQPSPNHFFCGLVVLKIPFKSRDE